MYVTREFVRYKTITLMLHKDGLTSDFRSNLNIMEWLWYNYSNKFLIYSLKLSFIEKRISSIAPLFLRQSPTYLSVFIYMLPQTSAILIWPRKELFFNVIPTITFTKTSQTTPIACRANRSNEKRTIRIKKLFFA